MGSEEEYGNKRRAMATRGSAPCALITLIVFLATALVFNKLRGGSTPTPVAAESATRTAADDGPIVLRNGHGVEVHVLPTGASIQKLLLPDRSGTLADVVLGFDTETPYADGTSPYFGAIVGRVANRIANATFTIDGRRYHLGVNEKGFPGSLHGGFKGFDKVKWTAERLSPRRLLNRRHGQAVRLSYTSPNGEEGYPGMLEVEVVYTLIDSARATDDADVPLAAGGYSELIQTISATVSGVPTPVNLAQHSYFNLGGHASGSVLEHEMTLHNATRYLPVDAHRIPTGEMRPVHGSAFDFLKPRSIGSRIGEVDGPGWRAGYDHCFVLHKLGEGPPPRARSLEAVTGGRPPPSADAGWWYRAPHLAATLSHRSSGRTMEVLTNAPALQVYTSNFLDASAPMKGTKGGAVYGRYGGLCLETQSFPNGPAHADDANQHGTNGPDHAAVHHRMRLGNHVSSRRMGGTHSNHVRQGPRVPYPTGTLRPGERYRHTTVYRFSTRQAPE